MTAIRLEALTHKSLPKNGPGYASNGNFVLSEFELWLVPAKGRPQRIRLATAVADHSQSGYPVMHAIDGKKKTGWAINTRGEPANVNREAIFILKKPRELQAGCKLLVKLRHDVNRNYMIGNFRLSATDKPVAALGVPPSLRKTLALPAARRTEIAASATRSGVPRHRRHA